jgi:hypothetical protein
VAKNRQEAEISFNYYSHLKLLSHSWVVVVACWVTLVHKTRTYFNIFSFFFWLQIYSYEMRFIYLLTDLAAIRKILENEADGSCCPSCCMPFDKGKKRKLIDTCGHAKCYSCMFKNESCTICANTQQRHQEMHDTSGKFTVLITDISFFFVECSNSLWRSTISGINLNFACHAHIWKKEINVKYKNAHHYRLYMLS